MRVAQFNVVKLKQKKFNRENKAIVGTKQLD